jgi:drug/metabolite transporter (DMT)-like permease
MLSAAVLREERHSRHTLVGVGLTVAGVVLLLAR